LGGWYVSGGLWSIFKINSQGAVNFGIQKTLLDKKATLKLNVQDIFFTNKATATTQYGSVDIISSNTWDSRQVRLTFSYRFGNSKYLLLVTAQLVWMKKKSCEEWRKLTKCGTLHKEFRVKL
jgi:hypothetical protein